MHRRRWTGTRSNIKSLVVRDLWIVQVILNNHSVWNHKKIAIGFEYIVGYIVVDIMMTFATTISGQINNITTISGQINEKCGFLWNRWSPFPTTFVFSSLTWPNSLQNLNVLITHSYISFLKLQPIVVFKIKYSIRIDWQPITAHSHLCEQCTAWNNQV